MVDDDIPSDDDGLDGSDDAMEGPDITQSSEDMEAVHQWIMSGAEDECDGGV